ncbi:MAG: hypothetical protein ABII82_01030, partial [Verrucomicrobiota bacterium]
VNARSEYFRPTIISTRFSGHSFKERFDSEAVSIGTDLARRLGRFCDVVEFGYKNAEVSHFAQRKEKGHE